MQRAAAHERQHDQADRLRQAEREIIKEKSFED
jgi:hypothetical protein